jgi:NTE family protein
MEGQKKLAIACQGGGSHTAFTAGVLRELLTRGVQERYELVGLSGTSGGAICAAAVWYGLLKQAAGATEPPYKWLADFWDANSAREPWEQWLNAWSIQALRWQEWGLLPSLAASPYQWDWLLDTWMALAPRREYFDFKLLLERHIGFGEIPQLVCPTSPVLFLGAVDALSGEFKAFDSRKGEITAEAVMASAAIPRLFKAVKIGQGAYWDGLFSQNPPISQFLVEEVSQRPDEIWIVRINPKNRKNEPKTVQDISDRRNELAGNLSLLQEVRTIELVNQWLAAGFFAAEKQGQIKQIAIRWLEMSPAVAETLDSASTLERDPAFINQLIAEGVKQAAQFYQNLP